jgi:hypothetical protein
VLGHSSGRAEADMKISDGVSDDGRYDLISI